MNTRQLITAVATTACMASAHAALVLDFQDFASTAGLTLNGSAAQDGNALRLTPAIDGQAGSVFSTSTISLAANASFSTRFQFRFTNPDTGYCDGTPVCGADGLVFVVQPVSNSLGGLGYGIGYLGIPTSLGVEFDTWNNGGIDRGSSNHVGIDVNGDVDSLAIAEVTEADMNAGDIWNAWIDYDGASHELEVRLTRGTVRPVDALLSIVRDIANDLGTTDAYVGFTSATGASNANHDLLSWQFDNSFAPIISLPTGGTPVPEPGSAWLALSALAGLGAAGLRRRKSSF